MIWHRAPVDEDGNEKFTNDHKTLMTIGNLSSSDAGKKVFKTLSKSNFRTLYKKLQQCVQTCKTDHALFATLYADATHIDSCPLGVKTCVACLMQSLDRADEVEQQALLKRKTSKKYLTCRENKHVDAHARELLADSAAHHASYCTVTVANGCLCCLDELRSRGDADANALSAEEVVILNAYEEDIEASRDGQGKSRALVRRKREEPARKKQKKS